MKSEEEVRQELLDCEKALSTCHPTNYQFMMGRITALKWWLSDYEKVKL